MFVNNYITKLNNENSGLNATGRLINKEELEALGCSSSSKTCSGSPAWVYSTTYWTGSASDIINRVWDVTSYGGFSNDHYSSINNYGVRPVITISES